MFKYLDDKNAILKSFSGVRGWYEKLKFKIEKDNFITEFIKQKNITHEILMDFSKMLSSHLYNGSGIETTWIDFGDGNKIYYNNIKSNNNMLNLIIESKFNNNSDMTIKISTQSNYNERFITITDNRKGIRLNYSLNGEYTEELKEYIDLLKRYMLYMLEYVLSGGLTI